MYDYGTTQEVDSSPAIGGFLAGGAVGIAVGTGSYYKGASDTDVVKAFTSRLVPVWSETLDGLTSSSPALADVEGSGQLEVVEGTDTGTSGSVWVLDGATGAPLWHTGPGGPGHRIGRGGRPHRRRLPGSPGADHPRRGGAGRPQRCRGNGPGPDNWGSRTRHWSPTTRTARSGSRSPATTATTKGSSSTTRSRRHRAPSPSGRAPGRCSTMTPT